MISGQQITKLKCLVRFPITGSVSKPGPARRVDPGVGPVRVWQKTGQCNDPGETRPIPGFFFQMWNLKPISIYILCSQEKNYVFSMWDKKLFGLNILT